MNYIRIRTHELDDYAPPPHSPQEIFVETIVMMQQTDHSDILVYALVLPDSITKIAYTHYIQYGTTKLAKLGRLLSIHLEEKIAILDNNMVVSFQFSIITTGIQPPIPKEESTKEIDSGICALFHALRIKNTPLIQAPSFLFSTKPKASSLPHLYNPKAISPHFMELAKQFIPKLGPIHRTNANKVFLIRL